MKVIFEAKLGQFALQVGCDPECNVIVLNLAHVVSSNATEEKKGLPPAIRASDSRGRFIPVFDNKLLQPNIRPRTSSRRWAGSSLRTMKKAR